MIKNNAICFICRHECHKNYLGTHLIKSHGKSFKEYYDLYLLKPHEGICIICYKMTSFRYGAGYNKTCSRKCSFTAQNRELLKKSGVINPFQLQEIKNKIKLTLIKKYGVDNPSKYKVFQLQKQKTCMKNYGVQHPGQSEKIKQLINQTNIAKYGFSNPMHNQQIASKAILNGSGKSPAKVYITKFNDRILIQGKYEKMFVNFCEENEIPVKNGPAIEYEFNSKPHRYFVDFQVSVNGKIKLVEIKSTYWYYKFKDLVDAKNIAVKEYAAKNDFEFLFFINDNDKKQIDLEKFEKIKE